VVKEEADYYLNESAFDYEKAAILMRQDLQLDKKKDVSLLL